MTVGTYDARASRANAFRVLSLGADAESRQIHRQKQRLLLAMEQGEHEPIHAYGLPPLNNLSQAEVLGAVNLLEHHDFRWLEELFWVHEMETLIDGQLESVLEVQRCAAAGKTTHAITAKHNLAVILSILGQESAANNRLDHWKEALKTWRELIEDALFWSIMRERWRKSGFTILDSDGMRVAVCRELSVTFSHAVLNSVKFREFSVVPSLVRLALEHRPWLNSDAALIAAGRDILHQGFVALKAILDHLSHIALQDDESTIRNSLLAREKELRSVAAEYGAMVRSLGELADGEGWENALAASKQRLAAAYVDLLDDPHEGVRLTAQARELAHEPQLLQSIKRDWQHMQRAVFCLDAQALAEVGDLTAADRKLVAALALSTEEEKTEIRLMQAHNRRKREMEEQGRRRVQRALLCREAEALLQTGEFARAEYKLSGALAVSSDAEKPEVKQMLERCRWGCVLREADTTRKQPFLFTSNGIGARFYGNRNYDLGTDSYVTTHWLTFLFVPVFPLGAYRVSSEDTGALAIHGRVALPGLLSKARWAVAACLLYLAFWSGFHQQKSARIGLTLAGGRVVQPAFPLAAASTAKNAADDERDVVLQDQAELGAILRSLEERQRKLALESVDLERQQGYLKKVASAYAGEKVPEGGQALLDSMQTEYTRRRAEFDKQRAGLNAEFIAYYDRDRALKLRMQALQPPR